MRPPGSAGSATGPRGFGPPSDDPLAARLFPPLTGSVRWGLDRMERILASLDAPHRGPAILHVGGSNGKGSVARIWASIMQEAGFRVGLYTSPHLVSFRERILVDGRPLGDERLEELADELRSSVVRFAPSFFEATTALAFLAFRSMEVEVAVIEVGLGGRLDATNVVSPVLTAITNVSMEHSAWLGDTVEAIAREKAGILKAGVPVYTAARHAGALRVLAEESASLGAPLTRVRPPTGRWDRRGLQLEMRTRRWGPLTLESPLLGDHQLQNVALAVQSLESLPPRLLPSARAVRDGVRNTRIPGRLQLVDAPPRIWLFDVAHNPDGMATLVRALPSLADRSPVVAVAGILVDKDWEAMLGELSPAVDLVLLTTPPGVPAERRWDPDEVVGRLPALELLVVDDLESALERAVELTRGGGTVVVTGSAYTVGGALKMRGIVPPEALPPSDDLE